jgi:hypothetical protein
MRQSEVARAQIAELVRLLRFQHVGLQQRVIEHATERDVVVGKNMAVVFEVLADDLGLRVSQQRLEFGQGGITVKLRGRAGIVVRQRQVGGHAGLDSKRDPDQFGPHGIEAGGFGVERKRRRRLQSGDPGIECGLGQDGLVVGAMIAAAVLFRVMRFRTRAGVEWMGVLLGGRSSCGDGIEVAQPGAEFVALEQRAQRIKIAGPQRQRVEFEWQRHIGLDGDQHACLRQPIAGGPQVVADHALDRVCMRQQIVERAVFAQPFHRGFRPHLGDAWHVVHGVADQRQVIDDALGRHPEFGRDAGFVERFLAHGVDQRHMVVDQLGHVLVAGGDDAADILPRGVHHQRADHVVGLDAVDHDERPALGADRLVQRSDLAAQIVRHGRAVRLVFGIEVVAKGLALRVEHAGDIIGRMVLSQFVQHGKHAPDRVGRFTHRVAQVGQRMKCAVKVGRAVHQ